MPSERASEWLVLELGVSRRRVARTNDARLWNVKRRGKEREGGGGREAHIGHWPTALVADDDGCNTIDVSLSCVGRPAKESRQASYLPLESESIRFEGGIVFRCYTWGKCCFSCGKNTHSIPFYQLPMHLVEKIILIM